MTAARHLGVPPWELARQPVYWRRLAIWHLEVLEAVQEHHRPK